MNNDALPCAPAWTPLDLELLFGLRWSSSDLFRLNRLLPKPSTLRHRFCWRSLTSSTTAARMKSRCTRSSSGPAWACYTVCMFLCSRSCWKFSMRCSRGSNFGTFRRSRFCRRVHAPHGSLHCHLVRPHFFFFRTNFLLKLSGFVGKK